jgi:N-acetylmuramoyl-L-alanine amidase
LSGKAAAVGLELTSRLARGRSLFRYFASFSSIFIGFFSLLAASVEAEAASVSAARVWPANDYTRVTFESAGAIQHKVFTLENPDRLVLDLEDVDMTVALTGLTEKIGDSDPYVKAVRVGRFKPGTVRLVFDLKASVKPQVFALPPVGNYSHRLVLDVYPLVPPDPLIAFLDRHQAQRDPGAPSERPGPSGEVAIARPDTEPPVSAAGKETPPAPKGRPASIRMITIVIDPGHGGEDPGALGRSGTQEKDVTLAIARRLK